MMWWTRVIPLLLLILPNVASVPKPECSPIDIADIYAAAQCSKMVYDYYNSTAEGQMVGDSNFTVVKEFSYDVKKEEAEPRDMLKTGHFLKAVIAQKKGDADSTTTMFCFMGTKSDEQLDMQVDPFLTKEWLMWDPTPKACIDPSTGTELKTKEKCSESDNKVHVFDYDWKTYQRFKSFIMDNFVPMIVAGQKYIITGHSLGGALSSLLAMGMTAVKNKALWKNRKSSLITFGQPRVGDWKFANFIDTEIPNDQKMRFVYHADIVPQVPPQGLLWNLYPGYWHHSSEIFITDELPNTSGDVWLVCPLSDTVDCGNYFGALAGLKEDHDMAHYLRAVKTVADSPGKVEKFMKDQCKGPDGEILLALKEERRKKKEEEMKRDDDDDDDAGKKAKKSKRKGRRTEKSKKAKH